MNEEFSIKPRGIIHCAGPKNRLRLIEIAVIKFAAILGIKYSTFDNFSSIEKTEYSSAREVFKENSPFVPDSTA